MSIKNRFIALTTLGITLGLGSCQAEVDNKTSSLGKSEQNARAPSEMFDNQDNRSQNSEQIDMQKLSEAFGNFIGRNLQSPGLKFDTEGIIKGIRTGASGQPSPLSEKEYEEMMAAVQEKAFKEMSTTNLKAADEFMSKNSKTHGITEIIPGKLQYTILKEGSGPNVETHSHPKINYSGKYLDGTVFGTSEEMGGPITIPLDQTIPGFSKGIVGMKEGEKRRLFVHPDLGYGTTGQLPPNELLIFDIEVVKANTEDEKPKQDGTPSRMDSSRDKMTDQDDDDEEDLYLEEDNMEIEPRLTPGQNESKRNVQQHSRD